MSVRIVVRMPDDYMQAAERDHARSLTVGESYVPVKLGASVLSPRRCFW